MRWRSRYSRPPYGGRTMRVNVYGVCRMSSTHGALLHVDQFTGKMLMRRRRRKMVDAVTDAFYRTILSDADPIVTFIHQMIPHHQNAVNMAKAMLATESLDADDEDDAGMIDMLWGIINVQNFQIHNMEAYLDGGGYDATAHCSGDSGAWYKKDAPHKDCAWVAKHLPNRCGVKGWDKSTACDSCADTCAGSC